MDARRIALFLPVAIDVLRDRPRLKSDMPEYASQPRRGLLGHMHSRQAGRWELHRAGTLSAGQRETSLGARRDAIDWQKFRLTCTQTKRLAEFVREPLVRLCPAAGYGLRSMHPVKLGFVRSLFGTGN
jgi:hypothetical protein